MRELKAVLMLLGVEFTTESNKIIGERIVGKNWDVATIEYIDDSVIEFMNHETEETYQGMQACVREILKLETK